MIIFGVIVNVGYYIIAKVEHFAKKYIIHGIAVHHLKLKIETGFGVLNIFVKKKENIKENKMFVFYDTCS